MKLTINRQHFLDKVDLLKGITKIKSMMPVTRNVLIELAGGNQGKISATDLEISAVTPLKCEFDGPPVKIMVKGGTLQEVLCNIKGADIEIDYPDEFPAAVPVAGNMIITQGRIEIGISIADPEEFPEIPVVNDIESIKLAAKDLSYGIHKVLYAVSRDETRYALTAMLMQVRDGKLVMCGTDGFRMALWKKDLKDEDDTPQILIPARNVKILKDALGEHANVGIIITEDKVAMMTDAVTVITRTLSASFPDYDSVVSGTDFQHIAFFQRIDMIDCLKRMAAVRTEQNPVELHRTPDGMLVKAKSDLGYCIETIDCKYKTAAYLDYAFNLKFLLDALEHLEGEEVLLRYPETYGACVLDETDYTCVVMPIRDGASPIEEAAKKPEKTRASSGRKVIESSGQEDKDYIDPRPVPALVRKKQYKVKKGKADV